jgi:hypothetical protein
LRERAALPRAAVLVARRFAEPCADFFAVFFVADGFAVFVLADDFLLAEGFADFLADGFAAFLAADFTAFLAGGLVALLAGGFPDLLAAGFVAFLLVAAFAVFLFVSALSAFPATEAAGVVALRRFAAALGAAVLALTPPVRRSRPLALRARAPGASGAARAGTPRGVITSGSGSLSCVCCASDSPAARGRT